MDELVKRLRYCSEEHSGCGTCELSDTCVLRTRLLLQAADAIEKLSVVVRAQKAVLDKFPRWIPVAERLPELNMSCLLYNKEYGPMVGARIDDMRFRIPGSRFPETPTHWMLLTEPPEEE